MLFLGRIANKKFIVLFLVPAVLYIGLISYMPLMEPDESRYSLIPRTMNVTGDYVTPHLKDVVYIEKPPLCYWATAMAFRIFGENEFSSRLFAALCAWGCILLAYQMGMYFHDEKTGLYSAAVLSTCIFHVTVGRINILDMPLAFFLCLAVWSGYRHFSDGMRGRKWIYGFYLFCALAFLTKGLIGIVLPSSVIFIWLLVSRRWRDVLRMFSPVGAAIFLAVSLPWLLLIQKANPDFFWFFFVREHFLRYTTSVHSRYEPFYFFIPVLVGGVIPWLGFLYQAGRGIGSRLKTIFSAEEKRILITWIAFIFVFFSISSSKLIPYIAPLFVPLAVLLGHFFRTYEDLHENPSGITRPGTADYVPIAVQTMLFIALAIAPVFLPKNTMAFTDWWPWIAVPVILQAGLALIPEYFRKRNGAGWFAGIYVITSLFIISMTFPISHYLTPFKSAYPMVQAIKKHIPEGKQIYLYNEIIYGIDFYAKMRTPLVDDIGELVYGVERMPVEERKRYFIYSLDLFNLYREGKELFLATEGRNNIARLKQEAPDMQILWTNGNYYLIRLKKVIGNQG